MSTYPENFSSFYHSSIPIRRIRIQPVILLLAFIFCSLTNSHALFNLEKANAKRYYFRGNYAKALEILRPLAKKEKEDSQLYSLMGNCYEKLRKYSQAQNYYRQALQMNPHNLQAQRGLQRVGKKIIRKVRVRKTGLPGKEDLIKIRERINTPVSAPIHQPKILQKNSGSSKLQRGRTLPAIPNLSLAERVGLIEDLIGQKLLNQAETELNRLKNVPEKYQNRVRFAQAQIFFKRGQLFEAVEKLNTVLSHQSEFYPALYLLAQLRKRLQQPEKAMENLKKYLTYRPENSRVRWELGNLLARNKKYEEAITQLKKAQQSYPESIPLATSLINLQQAFAQNSFKTGYQLYYENRFSESLSHLNQAERYQEGLSPSQQRSLKSMISVSRLRREMVNKKRDTDSVNNKKFNEKYIKTGEARGYIESVAFDVILDNLKRFDDSLVKLQGVVLKIYGDYGHRIALITEGRNNLKLTENLSQYNRKDFRPNKKLSDQNIFLAFIEKASGPIPKTGDYVEVIGEVEPILYSVLNDHAEEVKKLAVKAKSVLIKEKIY